VNGRNRELLAHIAVALSRYEKEAKREGRFVPPELDLILEFVMDCATPRQDATPLGDGENLVDAESMTNHPVLTKREAAASLRIHVRSLERLIASGALSSVRVAGSTRVRRTDLDAYIASLAGPSKFEDGIETKEPA